ncbi:MAG: right-handed parallel beta-helix repeat-containing protein [Anaerolineae bacterium]|nr:right-handed parallel beta-helix repeat-containing protein [Thermoflexales bacterium]MDW8407056.1 right-handed parallel beta-helix repeat-containing protein [Anaerolineae bacterium]
METAVKVWPRRQVQLVVGLLSVLMLELCGLWPSVRPAWAQELPPQARQIIRPDLAYPAEYPIESAERRAEQISANESAPAAQAGGQPGREAGRQTNRPVAPLREWTQPTFDWSRIPLAGIQTGEGRFAPAGPAAPLAGNLFVNSTADINAFDSVLTLREAILVANGALTGTFSSQERAALQGCTFDVGGYIIGGCGANIQDTIWFSPTLGFRPVITLSTPLPPISDTRATLLLGAFTLFGNNVQPVINAQNLASGQPGLVVNSNDNQIVAVSVINALGVGIRLNGNQNLVGTWTMVRNNGNHGIYIAGLTNTVSNSYIGVFSNTLTNQLDCAGNAYEGIYLASSARATTIQKNVIACNGQGGILVGNSSDNLIGGSNYVLNGNAIYSNTYEGIYISGSNARRNVIQANDILDNGTGVRILAGRQNTITIGASWVDFNQIVNNYSDGVRFQEGAQSNVLAGVIILGNNRHGVNLIDSDTLGNTITRTIIANNTRDGIRQDPNAGPNIWREMSIYSNNGLGIDTDAADDSSNTPNPPFFFITSVNQNTGLVQGKANGTALLVVTIVDLYRIALDPTGFGEGYEFVGSATTDVNGNWSIIDPNPSLSRGCYTAVVRGVALVLPYATEFTRTNCAAFVPITRKP